MSGVLGSVADQDRFDQPHVKFVELEGYLTPVQARRFLYSTLLVSHAARVAAQTFEERTALERRCYVRLC